MDSSGREQAIDEARRRMVLGALGFGLGSAVAPARAADGYPQQPVTLIVSLQAGSASDLAGRLLADRLGPALGTSVTVANLLGAGGVLGATKVFNARPDGYVLGAFNNGLLCVIPNLPRGQPVDVPALVPVAMMANLPSVLVVPASVPLGATKRGGQPGRSRPRTKTSEDSNCLASAVRLSGCLTPYSVCMRLRRAASVGTRAAVV